MIAPLLVPEQGTDEHVYIYARNCKSNTHITKRVKTAKKYTTFEDLKSSEETTMDYKISLKKHTEFEKVIKAIYAVKVLQNATPKSR